MAGKINGFTLMEIIITLTILAIALAIAIPDFSNYITDYQMSSQINKVYSDLQFAKLYAITHKVQTIVSFDTDNSDNYEIYYKNGNSTIVLKNVNAGYPMASNNTSTVTFDSHGFADNSTMLYVNTQNNANPNCIIVNPTEINTGEWKDNACISE